MATMTIITEQRSLCITVEKFQREALSSGFLSLSLSFLLSLLFILLSRPPLPYSALKNNEATEEQSGNFESGYVVTGCARCLENSSIPVEAARGAVIKHWRTSRILKREPSPIILAEFSPVTLK